MTSIGTLFAFILVCRSKGWCVKRCRNFRVHSKHRCSHWYHPGVATCLFMMVFLPMHTWIRLSQCRMLIGIDIYSIYGAKTVISATEPVPVKGWKLPVIMGILLAVLLKKKAGFLDQNLCRLISLRTLLYISGIGFAVFHAGLYASKLAGLRTNNKVPGAHSWKTVLRIVWLFFGDYLKFVAL